MDRNGQSASNSLKSITEDRAIARAMTQLASSISEVETAARDILSRVGPLIPGGSPFERDRAVMPPTAGNVPQPVRSSFCEAIDSRIYQLTQIAERLNEAARSVEL